jgi:hypothetical protein
MTEDCLAVSPGWLLKMTEFKIREAFKVTVDRGQQVTVEQMYKI